MRLEFLEDGAVQVRLGKVELGQGILTALAQIAADELGLPLERVRIVEADTRHGPDEGVTSGSLSVQDAGAALRAECAQAREARGLQAAVRPAAMGRSVPRLDLPGKFRGRPAFIHDLASPGMLHGRVLHPPRPDGRLVDADLDAARAVAGVVLVRRDGNLLGLLAESSAAADKAIARLADSARWTNDEPWLDERAALDALQRSPARTTVVDERGGPAAAGSGAHADANELHVDGRGLRVDSSLPARTLRARYRKPWIAHASIAPCCALAQWHGDALEVWTHSQGIFNLRRDLAQAFGLDSDAVRVRHAQGAGCYGHNGADDVAFDAAWLARAAQGRPVRVLWRREDELSRAPLGPGMVVELEADLDDDGAVRHWRHAVWSQGHSNRPGRSPTPALLGSWQTGRPFERPASINMPLAVGGGAERNAVPGYSLPAWRIVSHLVELPAPRSSALRSLGAFGNVFALESFVDELAHATGDDPLEWRRRHLGHDPRGLAVLEAAAARAGWGAPLGAEGLGRGIGYARYKNTGAWCAVVAEVEAAERLRVRRLDIAVDVGLAVNPDGVVAQIEGGAIQATSWALKEAVRFGADGMAVKCWDDYPILKFSEVPEVDVHVLPSEAPSLGAGEASLGPTVAAIANALFDALGVRVRELPLSPENIVAAIHASSD